MAGWLWVVWALEVLACILCLLRLFLVSARLLPFLLLACLLVGYLERASAAKWSEAAAIPFLAPSSVAGYYVGRTPEDH